MCHKNTDGMPNITREHTNNTLTTVVNGNAKNNDF